MTEATDRPEDVQRRVRVELDFEDARQLLIDTRTRRQSALRLRRILPNTAAKLQGFDERIIRALEKALR